MMSVAVGEAERLEGGRLAELYARHAPEARRLAYLLTGDRAQAEDLVQDSFVRITGRFLDLRDPDGFGHYLRRTIVNLGNSHFRRRRLESSYVERQKQLAIPTAVEPDPSTRDAVWRALQRLPVRQRAAIVLRYYEDLSEEQISEILKCRRGTVKSLVSRGLDALRADADAEIRGE
jgi:RNA polymerase sigma-70 factor (sigma-E family)